MDPELINSSYISPFKKTFKISKSANYFTKIISLHYINSLLHMSKLLASHKQNKIDTITKEDITLATHLLKDPIYKAEYKINKKILFSHKGGSKRKVIIKKRQNKDIVDKVLSVKDNINYQNIHNNLKNNIIFKPYSKVYTEFKKENNISISTEAKIKVAELTNELISQLLTLSYQKSELVPNNSTIHKNDILYTLLEL